MGLAAPPRSRTCCSSALMHLPRSGLASYCFLFRGALLPSAEPHPTGSVVVIKSDALKNICSCFPFRGVPTASAAPQKTIASDFPALNSILSSLISFQGGTIGLSSTPAEGNILWFELPLQPLDGDEMDGPLLERHLSENSIMQGSRNGSGGRSKGSSRSRVHMDIATLVREEDGSMRWEGSLTDWDRKGDDFV
jgi:hypothetical protein